MYKYKLTYIAVRRDDKGVQRNVETCIYSHNSHIDWIRDKTMIERDIVLSQGLQDCIIFSYQEVNDD